METKLTQWNYGLNSLVVFRGILKKPVMQALLSFLEAESADTLTQIRCYAEFVSRMYEKTDNWSECLLSLVMENENAYIIRHAEGRPADAFLEECVWQELLLLERLSAISSKQLTETIAYDGYLPRYEVREVDFRGAYASRIQQLSRYGYGIYSQYTMFLLKDGEVVPVRYPDETRLEDLVGYERERGEVIANTEALLAGKPAQNALLVGDAGTGKSSTVKAIVNAYAGRGLRLIEITKEQLRELPHVMDGISKNPLKFILFIDDLSFSSDDDCFGALKATLEGSVSARADNVVIYATSNRRHLIREQFSDREGDDVHRNDTMQQLISLSARFGLKVTFSKPDKKSYLHIVSELAKQEGVECDEATLALRAEAFALAGSGRSPRTAKQFVQTLKIEGKEI